MSNRIPVLFRVLRNDPSDVYALFPTLRQREAGVVTCYQHVGQHSTADLRACVRRSRPATRAEYRALRRELESAPYRYRLRLARPREKF